MKVRIDNENKNLSLSLIKTLNGFIINSLDSCLTTAMSEQVIWTEIVFDPSLGSPTPELGRTRLINALRNQGGEVIWTEIVPDSSVAGRARFIRTVINRKPIRK